MGYWGPAQDNMSLVIIDIAHKVFSWRTTFSRMSSLGYTWSSITKVGGSRYTSNYFMTSAASIYQTYRRRTDGVKPATEAARLVRCVLKTICASWYARLAKRTAHAHDLCVAWLHTNAKLLRFPISMARHASKMTSAVRLWLASFACTAKSIPVTSDILYNEASFASRPRECTLITFSWCLRNGDPSASTYMTRFRFLSIQGIFFSSLSHAEAFEYVMCKPVCCIYHSMYVTMKPLLHAHCSGII